MPLVEKCVTVDGSAIKEPKNVIVPIGTSIQDLIDFAGGFKEEPGKILYGGPMMGIAVPDANCPILKNTNAIIALNEKDAQPNTLRKLRFPLPAAPQPRGNFKGLQGRRLRGAEEAQGKPLHGVRLLFLRLSYRTAPRSEKQAV